MGTAPATEPSAEPSTGPSIEHRPRYHHGSLERALVDEAVRQIRERGADQVSLRGLAQAVGVSPSAAYQHFPDKAALLLAVCGAGYDLLAQRMRAAVGAVPVAGDAGAVGRFLAVGQAYVRFAVDEPHLFRHMTGSASARGSAFTHPDDLVRYDSGGEDPHDILLERLAELTDRGLLRPVVGDGAGLDLLAWSLVHGFSSLVVEGLLPVEPAGLVLDLVGRLALTDEAYAGFAAVAASTGDGATDGTTDGAGAGG